MALRSILDSVMQARGLWQPAGAGIDRLKTGGLGDQVRTVFAFTALAIHSALGLMSFRRDISHRLWSACKTNSSSEFSSSSRLRHNRGLLLSFVIAMSTLFAGQANAQTSRYVSCSNYSESGWAVGDEMRILGYCAVQSNTFGSAFSSSGFVFFGDINRDYMSYTVLSASASSGTLSLYNVMNSTYYTVSIGAIAPQATDLLASTDSGSSSTDNITNSTTPTFSGYGQISRTVNIRVGSSTGTIIATGTADAAGYYSLTSSALVDGTYAAYVELVDGGSTISSASALSVTVDTTAPVVNIATPISTDDIVAASDSSALPLSGSAAGAENGQTVTITATDGSATRTFNTTVTSGAWSTTVNVSPLADGDITFTANVSDVAGNAAATASVVAEKDTVVPEVAISTPIMVDGWVSAAESTSVTLSGTTTGVSDAITVDISVSGVSIATPAVAGSAWSDTVDLTGFADGVISFAADVEDSAGNEAVQVTTDITLDTTLPVVTDDYISLSGASGTGGVFKVGDTVSASWDVSGSDGDTNITASLGDVTVDFSDFGENTPVAASLSGTTWTAIYEIVANTSTSGSNLNVSVTATDKAGNATTVADTTNATVDAEPPVISAANIEVTGQTGDNDTFKIGDTVTATWDNSSSGDNNGDTASVSVDFTEFGGGSAVVATNSGDIWTATYTIVSGSIDLTSRNVTVTAVDDIGNETSQAGIDNVSVDNVAPTVTAVAISVSGQTGSPSNTIFKIGDTVSVSWDNAGTGDNNSDTINSVTVDFTDFGGGAAVAATNTSGVWTATFSFAAGTVAGSTYGVAIASADDAGNTTTLDDDTLLSLDNVETAAPSGFALDTADNSGSTSDTITNVVRPTMSGTAEADATIDVYVNGTLVGQATADGTGAWSYTFASDLAEGDNAITTTATDAVGNTSDLSTSYSLTIDTTAPTQPPAAGLDSSANTGSTSDLITSESMPSISGAAEANSTVEIFIDGTSVGAAVADSSGNWTFTLPSGALSEDENVITLTSTDTAGNTSTVSDSLTITLDTIIPTIAIDSTLMGDNMFNDAESTVVVLSGTTTDVDDGQTVTLGVSDGDTTLSFTTTVTSDTWSVTGDLSSLTDGTLTITADVADVADNDATQASTTITKDVVYPTVAITGPTETVTAAFDVTITFSEAVTDLDLDDILVSEGTATALTGSDSSYTATIDPVLGEFVQVSIAAGSASDSAGNLNTGSNTFEVQAGSAASAFADYLSDIEQVLADTATQSLRGTLSANQHMTRGARGRFAADLKAREACAEQEDATATALADCEEDSASHNSTPLDVAGTVDQNEATLSAKGSFFGQTASLQGTSRRLFFGDFDVQHNAETNSTTATVSARVAWEQMVSESTMLGYFIGGELATSEIAGAFAGEQDRFAIPVGGYAVHQLDKALFLDGFVSFGVGRNNLEIANDVLELDSDYTTRTATLGAALSGVYEYERYEFRPELAVGYGKTWIGDVGFAGRAYGLFDDTLSLDAGNVTVANLTLRPEVVWALDADTVQNSTSLLSFAPRLICERILAASRTDGCGGGAELGLSSTSEDGRSIAEVQVILDKVGNSNRSSFAFSLQHQF